jgi:hypothetical protein
MTLHAKVSGVLKEIVPNGALSVNVSGAWKTVAEGLVKVSGTWKQFYKNAVVTLSGETITGVIEAQLVVKSDGTVEKYLDGVFTQLDAATDWIIDNTAASSLYEVMFSQDSGSAPEVGTLDTWQDLGTDRSLGYNIDAPGSGIFTVQIRYNGGAPLSSAQYTIGHTGT